ncbi:MAG: COX15/CtaA family protein [Rhodospirillaceae bacterium]
MQFTQASAPQQTSPFAVRNGAGTRPARDLEDRAIGWWLLGCAVFVLAMVAVGGLTRLTGSGLSMTDWKPVTGFLPPMTEADWILLYDQYRATPEYRTVNAGFGLEGFKGIFWLEFIHRVLGRLIGLVFFVPLLVFTLQRRIPWRRLPIYLVVFALGGLQGLLGWYMVQSGLVDDPSVSPFRLTAHLGLAVVILMALLVMAHRRLSPVYPWKASLSPQQLAAARESLTPIRRLGLPATGLVFLTILAGGLVAGYDAGLMYNTFPTMQGQWIPDGVMALSPWWLNIYDNIITVQFNHRLLGLTTLGICLWLIWSAERNFFLLQSRLQSAPSLSFFRVLTRLLAFSVLLQIILGIFTLLLSVPIGLASAHQINAILVLSAALWLYMDSRAV